MTARAGSSEVFWGAAVTYADGAKARLLGVDPGLIQAEGAVSGAVALAMVEGLARASGVPLAVSITGVAGPGGGSRAKPVGTVWFGLGAERGGQGRRVAVRCQFAGSRAQIQAQAAAAARRLAAAWWESEMVLDSLRSLTDNVGKPLVVAFLTPSSPNTNPL